MSEAIQETAKEESHRRYQEWRSNAIKSGIVKDVLLFGVEKTFSTVEVARFFGRTRMWVYQNMKPDKSGVPPFSYRDGTPIVPERVPMGELQKRAWTLPEIWEIAKIWHRRCNINDEELEEIMAKILVAEFGEKAFTVGKKTKK
jgi:hypothetical protein